MPKSETTPVLQGDRGFVGVNTRLDPSLLPATYASEAINVEFVRGEPRTRGGSIRPKWCHQTLDELNLAWDDIQGLGLYSDPNGLEHMILATSRGGGEVWRLRMGNVPYQVPLNGYNIWGPVEFVQAFDALLMYRQGPDRYYFTGDDISGDLVTLHTAPLFSPGARVRFRGPSGTGLENNKV